MTRRIKDTSKTQPKIKHSGKTEPLLDSKKIAGALGTDKVMSGQKQPKHGKYYTEITSVVKNGRRSKKRVYDLTGKNLREYMLLGTAEGTDLFHCVYIAARHVKNFWERVYGYILWHYVNKFEISFYAKK